MLKCIIAWIPYKYQVHSPYLKEDRISKHELEINMK